MTTGERPVGTDDREVADDEPPESPGPASPVAAAQPEAAVPPPGLRLVWRIGVLAFGLQAVGLIVWSYHLWTRFDLTSDFATFYQTWHQIGTGHLDPTLTTFAYNYPHYGYPFWQSHFELLMWPLALLWAIVPSSFDLLVVQDLVLAGSGLVALGWALDLVRRDWPLSRRTGTWVGAGVLVVLLVNPWVYWTASYDFHFQPFATLFVLLAGRDIWAGRRRAAVWVVLALLCGDVAATYVLALGISALVASRATRRWGIGLIAASVVWLALIGLVGSGKGSSLPTSYGYLAHGTVRNGVLGLFAIGTGILLHPAAPLRVIHERLGDIAKYVASAGFVGIFSAIGLPMTVIVLGANGLNASAVFVGSIASFQSLVVVVFLAVGAAEVLCWIAGPPRVGLFLAGAVGVVVLGLAIGWSVHWTPKARTLSKVDAATASRLARVLRAVPDRAEVISSQGVFGRFGNHAWVYPFLDAFGNGQTVPIRGHPVVFVFTDAGIELATPAQTAASESYVVHTLHARPLVEVGGGVTAYLWYPPEGVTSITFPMS